jgi:hypothetical protein
MSFDEPDRYAADFDWDDVDPGDDEDYEPPYDDGWDDEADGWERDEPNCHACDDQGCRRCIPSRFTILRWRLRDRMRHLFRRRRPTAASVDEPPF